jgi:serine protease Do
MVIVPFAKAPGKKKPQHRSASILTTILRRSTLAITVACGSYLGLAPDLSSAQESVALPYAFRGKQSYQRDGGYRGNQSVSVRKPSIDELAPIRSVDINTQRERLFNELAEEFETFDRLGSLVRRVSQLVKPSVIHIEAHKTETKGGARQSYDEAGSGVIIKAMDESLWVLTNRHVIAGASPREILLRSSDGREFYPSKVVSDASTDVAVMRIDHSGLPAARLGDSEAIEIGDFVIAIGSPFGLSHSVTFGILSAKGRRDLSLGEQKIDLQDFFQTDAAINPGNSGGPLLNLRGEVVGLNTAIASSSGGSEGIGFAIPIDMAMRVADQLTRQGRLRRGYLGVTLDPDFTPADLAAANRDLVQAGILSGALVKNVRPGSPAEQAHLQRGDIIVEFDGKAVESDDHLVARVGLTPIGESTPMIIYRSGKRYRTEVSLADLN